MLNFFGINGNASEGQVVKVFKILNYDKKVKVVLVNIFGIMKCDVLASRIISVENNDVFKVHLICHGKTKVMKPGHEVTIIAGDIEERGIGFEERENQKAQQELKVAKSQTKTVVQTIENQLQVVNSEEFNFMSTTKWCASLVNGLENNLVTIVTPLVIPLSVAEPSTTVVAIDFTVDKLSLHDIDKKKHQTWSTC
ncbi:hypothetical protein GQ457_04G019280 [Hibiscus cannabinus]